MTWAEFFRRALAGIMTCVPSSPLRSAANKGHVDAQFELGRIHERGIGTPKNLTEAFGGSLRRRSSTTWGSSTKQAALACRSRAPKREHGIRSPPIEATPRRTRRWGATRSRETPAA